MTAHASPTRLIGPALPEDALCMTETSPRRVLLLTGRDSPQDAFRLMCQSLDVTALDIAMLTVASHHDLPFRLHHARPLAVISTLSTESSTLPNALRCIAAYDQDMPILLITEDDATALGTIDAARQLWGLTRLRRLTHTPAPHDLLDFLCLAGAGLMPMGLISGWD